MENYDWKRAWFTRALVLMLGVLLASALLPRTVMAQTGTGTVTITVQDPSGNVVPDSAVTVNNTQTGLTRSGQSSGTGLAYFGGLQPGPYSVEVEKDGFKKYSGTFYLEVGQNATVDAGLEVGAVTETIEVTDVATVIQIEST